MNIDELWQQVEYAREKRAIMTNGGIFVDAPYVMYACPICKFVAESSDDYAEAFRGWVQVKDETYVCPLCIESARQLRHCRR